MTIKTREIYSHNFNLRRRKNNQIKFLIFHYTGMKNEKIAIKHLSKIQSEVSTNYFIKRNGEIIIMVPDLYAAWHAGISQWGKYKFLNKHSIGIEISNPGHQFGYLSFSKKQIDSLIKLSRTLIKKYKIKKNYILGHSDVAPDRKIDPGEKFPWKILYKNKIGIWHNLKKVKLSSARKEAVSIKKLNLFMKNLSKFGYPEKSIIVKNKKKYNKLLVKAFQRRFRPELINGKIDQECLLILHNLLNNKV
tara:strand:- start:123 stop:866 length:744 start_codon:yes stop_codon:yes gene_type:complete